MPLVVAATLTISIVTHVRTGGDFREYLAAALRLMHGQTPWVFRDFHQAFTYPPLTAILYVPATWVPAHVGVIGATAACLAAGAAALYLLDVRSPMIYGVVSLWPAVVNGWMTANLTMLLVFGTALAWRCRDRPMALGAIVGAMISVKPSFVWPLLIWMLITRRWRALAWVAAVAVLLNLAALVALGSRGFVEYVRLIGQVQGALEFQNFSLVALDHQLGLPDLLLVAAAGALSVAALYRFRSDEARLCFCLALGLIIAPVDWIHYFAICIVPAALASRGRLGSVWLAPLAMWSFGPWLNIVTWCVTAGVIAYAAIRLDPELRRPPAISAAWALVRQRLNSSHSDSIRPAHAPSTAGTSVANRSL
jgi:hypothetical protein